MAETAPYTTAQKILDPDALRRQCAVWGFKGRRVVFTNGCFDVLHVGHVQYLEAARALGHALVVGLNTDASVSRLKGPTRPVNPEHARARVLAALQCVDAVVLFGEDTPLELIRTVRPDVLVKGADYTLDQIVGAPDVLAWGGTVQTITLVDGFSTTRILERLKG